MTERDLALTIYYLADLFGNDGVENGRMVNLLRLLNQEEPIGDPDELTRETRRLSDGIQHDLSRPGLRLIEGVSGRRSGGPAGDRGWRQITDTGRAEARTILSQIISIDMQN